MAVPLLGEFLDITASRPTTIARYPFSRGGRLIPQVEGLERYVPRVALEWDARAGASNWLQPEGTLLFVDISGFTNLSERLAARGRIGAEELTAVLGGVFGRMLGIVDERGGSMLKFGGDALLLLFEGEDHQLQAACAAIEMRAALRKASEERTSVGRVNLKMSSGIHSGPVDLFLVGTSHKELIVTGPTASLTTEMEAVADAGEILVSPDTAAGLPRNFIGGPKGEGLLLRPVRTRLSPHRPDALGTTADPAPLVPTALRDHLATGLTESEHRIASIGFIKFKGVDSYLANQGMDRTAEELHGLLGGIQAAADREQVTFLATDIDKDGGKVILAAGVPTARHDDEGRLLRALRAVIDLPSALSVQAGVNRGHVFAGNIGTEDRATYTVMGDTVNLAARLMTAAGTGNLFAAPTVLDLATTLFQTEPMEPFHVKGKTEPVRAFSVGSETGVKPPVSSNELPFRGRDTELDALVEIVTTCAQVGRGGAVTISGDTGIGKSRLIHEVLDRCPAMEVTSVQTDPYNSDNPFWALRDPLRRLIGVSGSNREELAESLERRIPEIEPSLGWATPLFGDLLHIAIADNAETAAIEPRFRPARTADVLISLLDRRMSEPFALVIEDQQWLDSSSAEVLRRVAEAAEARPWTVIGTTQDEAGDRSGQGTWIQLGPLSNEAIRSIAIEATVSTPMRPHELDVIVARVGGNPLFLSEILSVVRETGSADAIPDSLDAVVSKQIDTLRPLARRVLRQVSVLGRSFRSDVMTQFLAATGLTVDRATTRDLDGFIERDGRERTRFRHAVVHDVAYGGLAYRRRRELHAMAGAVIERMASDDLEGAAETLALHFSESGENEKAWHYARVAGAKAKRTYANAEAASQYRRALEAARHLDTINSDDVAQAWADLGEVSDLMGQYEAARDAFGRAVRLLVHDPIRLAELHLRRAEAWFGSGNLKQAKRSLTLARKAGAKSPDDGAIRARIDAYESSVHAANGDPGAALAAASRAVDGAKRSGEEEALARAYGSMDWANFMLGNGEPRRGAEAVEILNRLGQVDRSAMTMNMMGAFAYLEGDWDGAVEWYERSVQAAEASGNAFHAANTRANIAEVLIGQRRAREAIPLLKEAERFFRASGSDLVMPFVDLQMARARADLGDFDFAIPELERLFDDQISAGEGFSWPETAVALADAQLRSGDTAAAMKTIDVFSAEMPESASRMQPAIERIRAQAALQSGLHEDATRHARLALDAAQDEGDIFGELQILEALVEIESGAGMNPDPARITRASDLATRLGVASPLASI